MVSLIQSGRNIALEQAEKYLHPFHAEERAKKDDPKWVGEDAEVGVYLPLLGIFRVSPRLPVT